MERRQEQFARARKLEQSDQPRAALDLLLDLANVEEDGTGALWTQIGELQHRLDEPDAARESLSRAVARFSALGQVNNAIAICLRRIEIDPADLGAHRDLERFAIEKGYPALEARAKEFLARHTGDLPGADTAEDVEAEEADMPPDLPLMGDAGAAEVAGELDENTDLPLLDHFSDEADAGEEISADLPLLGNAPESDASSDGEIPSELSLLGNAPDEVAPDEIAVAPLEGFEPTRFEPDAGDATDAVGLPGDASAADGVDTLVEAIGQLTDRTAEASDGATHYDLGLAFKEMGLANDALAQLAAAIRNGHDPVAVLEVVGEVLVERGDYDVAARILRMAPGGIDAPAPELVGVHYWLARSEEGAGDSRSARRFLEWVVREDPSFRDAAQRLGDPTGSL